MTSRTDVSAAKPVHDFAELSIAISAGLVLALTTLFVCVVPLSGKIAGSRDFVVFWGTGQQLVHHANPYDPAAMGQIERNAGISAGYGTLYMRNPPWALPLVLPLGLVNLRIGALLWSLAIVACLLASVHLLWQMHGRPENRLHWLGYAFGPAMVCILMGQSSLFALLGYVLFQRMHRTRPFLAGASLWLCALKPHLFVPFGVVLLVWALATRSYRILAGAAVAVAGSCVVAALVDPTVWVDYARMMHAAGFEKEYVPCLNVVLRLWLRPQSMWLQYLAPVLASAWALVYFRTRRHAWDWSRYGGLLVLVSLVAAPYSWVYDGGLAIPALLDGIYVTRSRFLLVVLAIASLMIEIELVWGIKVASAFYLWTAPAWLAWYLLARASARKPIVESAVVELESNAACESHIQ